MTCFLLSAGAYLVLLKASHLAVVSIMAALVGLSFGAMFTVSAPLILHCFGLVNFGRIFGLVFTAYGFVAGMLGPWLSGVMLDRTGGAFAPVYAYFAFLYMISAFLITRVKKINVDVRS
jgi:OFA family oxalate/formate antiporter-like MFS transporter